jgi:hypothetical protein
MNCSLKNELLISRCSFLVTRYWLSKRETVVFEPKVRFFILMGQCLLRGEMFFPRSEWLFPWSEILFPRSELLPPRSGWLLPRSEEFFPRSGEFFPRSELLFPRSGWFFPWGGRIFPQSLDGGLRSQGMILRCLLFPSARCARKARRSVTMVRQRQYIEHFF